MAVTGVPKGIGVPFRFDDTGFPAPDVELEILNDSIFTILSTAPGERVYRPLFGSFLRQVLFEPMSRATAFRARAEVFRSVRLWEPRVRVQDVFFDIDDTTINLYVSWSARGNLSAVTALSFPVTTG